MNMFIRKEMEEAAFVANNIVQDDIVNKIKLIGDKCVNSLNNGGKIIFAGNGGSAADAQHFAAELVGRFYFERPGLSSIALNVDTSMLTAIGNDYGFEYIFERQLRANGNEGDIFIGISTSGNSKNILEAVEYCNTAGITTVGLTGMSGGKLKNSCEIMISVDSKSTPRIQEAHTIIGHSICAYIEREIHGQNNE